MSQMPPPGGPGWGQPDQAPAPGWGPEAGAPPPASGPAHGPPPGDPYGQQPGFGPPPGDPYGPQPGFGPPPGGPGGPPGKQSNPALPIVIVLVLVAAVVGGFFLLSGDDDDDETSTPPQGTLPQGDLEVPPVPDVPDVPDVPAPGDGGDVTDPDMPDIPEIGVPDEPLGEPTAPPLDTAEAADEPEIVGHANSCYEGDLYACDEVYFQGDIGGELEAYGSTCGGRVVTELDGLCAVTHS
jgi:hypothetical protein